MLGFKGQNWYNTVGGLFLLEVATICRIVGDHPSNYHISIRRSNTAICILARSSAHYLQSRHENKRKLPRKEKPYGNTWKPLLSQASLVLHLFFHTRRRYPDLLRLRLQYQFYTSCAHSFQRAYHPHHPCLCSFPDFSRRDPGLLRFAPHSWSHNVPAQESTFHCA